MKRCWWLVACMLGLGCGGGTSSGSSAHPAGAGAGGQGASGGAGSASSSSAGSKAVAPRPSMACSGGTPPAPGDQMITMGDFRAGGRSFILHTPTHAGGEPLPFVVNMHGFLSTGSQQEALSRMAALADEKGFYVAFPDGAGSPPSWNAGDCCDYDQPDRDDVAFISGIIDQVAMMGCIDLARVYATGFSNGGFMSHMLACKLGDRVAAVASVSGVLGIAPADCTASRAMPVMQIHGTSDPIVPYNGGQPTGWAILYPGRTPPTFRSVADTVAFWRDHDGCAMTTHNTYAMGDASCETYDGCGSGSELVSCKIDQGGHSWPGGDPNALGGGIVATILGKTSTSLDASTLIWDFFTRHPLPANAH